MAKKKRGASPPVDINKDLSFTISDIRGFINVLFSLNPDTAYTFSSLSELTKISHKKVVGCLQLLGLIKNFAPELFVSFKEDGRSEIYMVPGSGILPRLSDFGSDEIFLIDLYIRKRFNVYHPFILGPELESKLDMDRIGYYIDFVYDEELESSGFKGVILRPRGRRWVQNQLKKISNYMDFYMKSFKMPALDVEDDEE